MTWIKRIFGIISTATLLHFPSLLTAAETLPIARFHFVGLKELSSNADATNLNKILDLPQTTQLRETILQKIAVAPGELFPNFNGKQPATNSVALLQPLLTDLLQHESIVDLSEGGGSQLNFGIATRIDQARSEFWASNLLQLLPKNNPQPKANQKSWTIQVTPEVAVAFTRSSKWTIVTVGSPPQHERFVSRIGTKEFSMPRNNCLQAHLDWKLLEQYFGISIPFKFTQTDLSVSEKADNLFTTVVAEFPEKIEWKSEPWQIPRIIQDPIVSFTASQPLAPFCKESAFFKQIEFNPLAHQFYFWSQFGLPFQTFGAVLVNDATNELKTLATKLVPAAAPLLHERRSGALGWNPAAHALLWTNVEMMAPSLKPYKDQAGEFIIGGLFPAAPQRTPPPNELLQQISGKSKLVYYDWEITQNRIGHWDMLTRTLPVLSPEKITDPTKPLRLTRNSRLPAHVWIRAVAPFLGNTVTEVLLTGPKEVTLKRKSNIGLIGAELLYFAGLVDHPDFPLFGHAWPIATSSGKR